MHPYVSSSDTRKNINIQFYKIQPKYIRKNPEEAVFYKFLKTFKMDNFCMLYIVFHYDCLGIHLHHNIYSV